MRRERAAGDVEDEAQLVRRARSGSREAQALLYERYLVPAWRAALLVTGRRELAEEVVQDAFLRAFAALDRFDDARPLRPWLLRIVTNHALNVARAERRAPLEPAGVDRPMPEWAGEDGRAEDARRALAELSPDARAVVALRFWFDFSPPEIAAALGVPVGTVHSRLSRALAALRDVLEETRP